MTADSKGKAYPFTVLVSQPYRKLKEFTLSCERLAQVRSLKDIEGALAYELPPQARSFRELRLIPCLWRTK
jgi:hypothetical protein